MYNESLHVHATVFLVSSGNVAVPGFIVVWLSRFDNMSVMLYLQRACNRAQHFRVKKNLVSTVVNSVKRQ